MLIKIAKAPYLEGSDNNSFMLIQVKEVIRFQTQPYWRFDEITELQHAYALWLVQGLPTLSTINIDRIESLLHQNDEQSVFVNPIHEEKIYQVNYIVARDMDGKEQQYVFDTIAYICNDEGKTLEKCFAGGILNKD